MKACEEHQKKIPKSQGSTSKWSVLPWAVMRTSPGE